MLSSRASMIKALGLVSMLVVLNMGKVTSADSDSSEGNKPTHRCNGSGDRFCGDAHEESQCPRICRPDKCRDERPRSRMEKQYDAIIKDGAYDFVYHWQRGRKICIAHCKDDWRKMKCNEGTTKERFWNLDGEEEEARYCPMIDCSRVDEKIEGCHHGDKDFIEPTCEMCRRLFPKACAPKPDEESIRRRRTRNDDDSDDDDGDDEANRRRRNDDNDDDNSEREDDSSDSSDVTAAELEKQPPKSISRKDLDLTKTAIPSWKVWNKKPNDAPKSPEEEVAVTPSWNTWTWRSAKADKQGTPPAASNSVPKWTWTPATAGKQSTPPAASNSAATISQERVSRPAWQQAPWKKANATPLKKEEAEPSWKWTPKKAETESAVQKPNSTKKKEEAKPSWKWTTKNLRGQGAAGQKPNSE